MNNKFLKKSLRFAGICAFLILLLYAGYIAGTMQSGETNKTVGSSTKYAPSAQSGDSPFQGIVEDAFAAIGGMITNSGNLLVTGFLDFRGNLVDGGTVIYNTGTNKIEQSVLPFNQGDLIAPGDRPLISGLASYLTSYFNIANLGISGSNASKVSKGVAFGPGDSIIGTAGVPAMEKIHKEDYCPVAPLQSCSITATCSMGKTIEMSGVGFSFHVGSESADVGGIYSNMRVNIISTLPNGGCSGTTCTETFTNTTGQNGQVAVGVLIFCL